MAAQRRRTPNVPLAKGSRAEEFCSKRNPFTTHNAVTMQSQCSHKQDARAGQKYYKILQTDIGKLCYTVLQPLVWMQILQPSLSSPPLDYNSWLWRQRNTCLRSYKYKRNQRTCFIALYEVCRVFQSPWNWQHMTAQIGNKIVRKVSDGLWLPGGFQRWRWTSKAQGSFLGTKRSKRNEMKRRRLGSTRSSVRTPSNKHSFNFAWASARRSWCRSWSCRTVLPVMALPIASQRNCRVSMYQDEVIIVYRSIPTSWSHAEIRLAITTPTSPVWQRDMWPTSASGQQCNLPKKSAE